MLWRAGFLKEQSERQELKSIRVRPLEKVFLLTHGSGVIIGETAELGDNITLYQGVTLGGTGKEQGKRHPTLGE